MLVDIEPQRDDRGFFARTWCAREFRAAGLCDSMVQGSVSFSRRKGTLRGMHFHAPEFPQARLLRPQAGAAFVVVLDLRPDSPAYLQHEAWRIEGDEFRAVYAPPGVALGFQTLQPDTLMYYLMPEYFEPRFERGVRWNDPAFGIGWPEDERTIIERDADYPDFDAASVAGFAGQGGAD